jgi:hypothetical protein
MSTLSVHMEFPRDLLGALDLPESALSDRLREVVAVGLFREGNISAGKAAELLDVSKEEFVNVLARHGVPYFSEAPGEIGQQAEIVGGMLRRDRP